MAKWDLDKLKKGKKMTKYTRADILDTAKQYVTSNVKTSMVRWKPTSK